MSPVSSVLPPSPPFSSSLLPPSPLPSPSPAFVYFCFLSPGSGSGIPPTPVQPVECNGTQYMISNSSCADCNCHVNGSTSTSCEDTSGACLCRRDAYGLKCNMCRSGFYQPISADVYTARCWQTCQYNAEAFCQGEYC